MTIEPIIIVVLVSAAIVSLAHGAWRAAGVLGGIALVVTVLLAP